MHARAGDVKARDKEPPRGDVEVAQADLGRLAKVVDAEILRSEFVGFGYAVLVGSRELAGKVGGEVFVPFGGDAVVVSEALALGVVPVLFFERVVGFDGVAQLA